MSRKRTGLQCTTWAELRNVTGGAERALLPGTDTPSVGTSGAGIFQGEQTVQNKPDMVKVGNSMESIFFDKSPSLVNGQVEQFGNVTNMVRVWSALEMDDAEWKPGKERRIGGRKISRRISELLMNFQEEGGDHSGMVGTSELDSLEIKIMGRGAVGLFTQSKF